MAPGAARWTGPVAGGSPASLTGRSWNCWNGPGRREGLAPLRRPSGAGAVARDGRAEPPARSLSGSCASAPAIRAREVLELKPPARKVEQQLFAGEAPAVT